jgi:hypothetical protein
MSHLVRTKEVRNLKIKETCTADRGKTEKLKEMADFYHKIQENTM